MLQNNTERAHACVGVLCATQAQNRRYVMQTGLHAEQPSNIYTATTRAQCPSSLYTAVHFPMRLRWKQRGHRYLLYTGMFKQSGKARTIRRPRCGQCSTASDAQRHAMSEYTLCYNITQSNGNNAHGEQRVAKAVCQRVSFTAPAW